MAIPFVGIGEWAYLSATVGTSETTVAHGGTVAPDAVIPHVQNAAAHYVGETKAADATNVYLISDAAAMTVKCFVIWTSGAKKTS